MSPTASAALAPPAYTVAEAAKHSGGLSRSRLYEEIKAGRLIARKAGRRTLIAHSDLVAYIENLPRVEAKS